LLLLRHTANPSQAGHALIAAAARDTLPDVPLLFWSFRAMALLGVYAIILFGCAVWLASKRRLDQRVFLRIAAWSQPVPWVAGALGWIVSEAGRGAWLVDGLLPVTETHLTGTQATIGAIAFVAMGFLVVTGGILITRLVRLGPEGLGFWPMDPGRAGRY
jgi:cytochrome d ubiquinol oxidase subunit I